MYRLDKLCVTEMTVEHMIRPLGNDCILPRFGWKIQCDARNVRQTAYRLVISSEAEIVADWMYRHIGGLQPIEPGYKRFRVKPSFSSGLTSACVSEETPYGKALVEWQIVEEHVYVRVEVPANTEALVELPGMEETKVGSGRYHWILRIDG